MKLPTELALI